MITVTHQQLLEILDYNPISGIFIWKKKISHKTVIGKVCGCYTRKNRYVYIELYKKRYVAHRLAWFYVYGVWPPKYIDHVNGNKHDNRLRNLREATARDNTRNKSVRRNTKTGKKGVTYEDGKYRVRICTDHGRLNLGAYSSLGEAMRVYDEAAIMYHGEFARTNSETMVDTLV